MKLYYSPGACSLAAHIALREAGLAFDIDRVDLKTRRTEAGEDYLSVNPKGYVPALRLDDGEVITEGAAILQYVADQAPSSGLAPPAGTFPRVRLQEQLNYVASEVHKAFSPLFRPDLAEAARDEARSQVARRFDHVEQGFADGRPHLLGEGFTVADAYLFVVSSWSDHAGIDLSRWPGIAAFVERVRRRPSAQAALAAEGLA